MWVRTHTHTHTCVPTRPYLQGPECVYTPTLRGPTGLRGPNLGPPKPYGCKRLKSRRNMFTSSFYGGPRKPPKVCVNWWSSETTLHGFLGFYDVLLRGSNIVEISQSVDKRRYIYFSRNVSDSFYTPL